MASVQPYKAVVIGGSAGGREALLALLAELPADFPLGVVVVLHMHPQSDARGLAEAFCRRCRLVVAEAEEKAPLLAGRVYLAPANYHLLVEKDGRFALSVDPRVNYSRPSIDVLFESAADVWQASLIGVLLSGASRDGAAGLARIGALGGLTIVQDPATASSPIMPQAALDRGPVDRILAPSEIGQCLVQLAMTLPSQNVIV